MGVVDVGVVDMGVVDVGVNFQVMITICNLATCWYYWWLLCLRLFHRIVLDDHANVKTKKGGCPKCSAEKQNGKQRAVHRCLSVGVQKHRVLCAWPYIILNFEFMYYTLYVDVL